MPPGFVAAKSSTVHGEGAIVGAVVVVVVVVVGGGGATVGVVVGGSGSVVVVVSGRVVDVDVDDVDVDVDVVDVVVPGADPVGSEWVIGVTGTVTADMSSPSRNLAA